MSAETFVNALFLITAVVAAGILITAVLPIIWNMAGTFSAASHESDTRMRTDFKIVSKYCYHDADLLTNVVAKIWMKNIGSTRIGTSEIEKSDVFIGLVGNFDRSSFLSGKISTPSDTKTIDVPSASKWCYLLSDDNSNGFWDPGETLEVDAGRTGLFLDDGLYGYFQFVGPSSVSRESEFVTS